MLSDTMSRTAKGRVAPPPRLRGAAQTVAHQVAELPGVVAQAHWEIGSQTEINGTDFYVGEHELGHIHLDGEAHVPVGRKLAELLIHAGLARRFPWSREFVVVDTGDIAHAAWMFGLRHAQIAGTGHTELAARVASASPPLRG